MFLFVMVGVVGACARRQPPVLPVPSTAPSLLEQAEASLEAGDLSRSAELFRQVINEGDDEDQARARFGLALIHAGPESGWFDPVVAASLLEPLAANSGTPRHQEARVVLALLVRIRELEAEGKRLDQEIGKITDELRKLKEIDLQRRPR